MTDGNYSSAVPCVNNFVAERSDGTPSVLLPSIFVTGKAKPASTWEAGFAVM